MSHMYRLTLEYDGTMFSGWQVQPTVRTVEGVFRQALAEVTGEHPPITAAGRTDAGAHAHGQVVGVAVEREWRPEQLVAALNARLPEDIVTVAGARASRGFHARFDAERRTYRYMVLSQRRRPAVARKYAWYVGKSLDVDAMRACAALLRGTHDFAGFGRSPREGGTTRRTVHEIAVRTAAHLDPLAPMPSTAVAIEVTADAFLYGMMRSIAGALVAVGAGTMSAMDVETLLFDPGQARRRPNVAPAHGLHQWSVTYPEAASGRTVIVRNR